MDKKKIFAISAFAALFFGFLAYLIFFQNIFGSRGVKISAPENMNGEIAASSEAVNEQLQAKQPETIIEVSAEKTAAKADNEKDEPEEKSGHGLLISSRNVTWGYAPASGRKIDTIIIHSSYDALGEDPYDVAGLINEYKGYGVAPHYLIDRKGAAYRLVAEKNIAYHAGESQVPDGRTDVNNFSIGIELMNKENGKFTDSQYNTLKALTADIKKRYTIKYTLGHNQIAPGRKTDPWNFIWDKL